MKKILILIAFMFSLFSFSVNATERLKSVEYDAIVNDPNGIDIVGKYKDEHDIQKEIAINIKYDTRVKVLYEYMQNRTLYGHIKFITTVVVKKENELRNSTNVKPDSYENQTSNNTTSNNQQENNNKKQDEEVLTEKEETKTLEVEADIDLSKCRIDDEFYLSNAVNLNETRKIMIVSKNGLDLYRGPALGYGKYEYVIPANTKLKYNYGVVNLTQSNKDFAWIYVNTESAKGWIQYDLINSGIANYQKGRILAFGNVSIKEFPNEESKTLGKLGKDLRKSFTYIYGIQDKNNEQWYYISYKKTKGWVKTVAIGVNTEIKTNNNIKLYENPNLKIEIDDIIIPKGTKLKSIYKYSKENDAFYIEYKGKTGWIILDKNKSDFDVKYLEDNVEDKLLDKDAPVVKKEEKKGINLFYIIVGIVVVVIIIIVIVATIVNKKRKQSNDFTVNSGDISSNSEKPKVTLINRSRMGR